MKNALWIPDITLLLRIKFSGFNLHSFFIFLSFLFVFGSCKKVDTEIKNSGIRVIGDQNDQQLITLISAPDGGFILGTQNRSNGSQKIQILKYSENFELQWSKTMGGNLDNKLFRVFVDRDENILVSGLSYGFEKDNSPLNEHKFWWPYFQLIQPSGEKIWEIAPINVVPYAGFGSGIEERITDVIQDEEGNYIIGSEFPNIISICSKVIRIAKDSLFVNTYSFFPNDKGKIMALYETGNSYSVFNFWDDTDTIPGVASMFKLPIIDTSNTNVHYDEQQAPWPWGGFENGSVAGLKQTGQNGNLMYNIIFENSIYRYTYDVFSSNLEGHFVNSDLRGIVAANTNSEGNFLFATRDGYIVETDGNFLEKMRFKTNWQVKNLCTLKNGDFILALEYNRSIVLLHYDRFGKVIEHE